MTLIPDQPTQVLMKTCYHCGDDCGSKPVVSNGHSFCCHGCETVYEILNGCSLESYYSLEDKPGSRPEMDITQIESLELEEVRQRLIVFENEDILKLQLFIPSIHCSSCLYLLEQLHRLDDRISSSRVNFQRKEVSITIQNTPEALPALFTLLQRIGYPPDIAERKDNDRLGNSRKLLIQLGITGFCFGNIMLFSIPEYISGRSVVDPEFARLFNILIAILIVPVLYFGAKDYFISAWKSLRHGHLNVDVPITLGISALLVRSIYEIALVGEVGYFDSLAGFVFFLLIGKWFQSHTYEHLSFDRDLKSFLPLAVQKKTLSGFETAKADTLERGDIIRLRNNEVLPVNGRLIDGDAEFDYSFVTGEALPVLKRDKDLLYAGGRLTSSSTLIMVEEMVDRIKLQELWKEQDGIQQRSSLMTWIDSISRKFTIAVIIIALSGLAYWLMISDPGTALEVFTSILIVACPCALALAAPFTFGNGARMLGKAGLYLKDSSILERLSHIRNLVFDKTGTLTKHDTSKGGIHFISGSDRDCPYNLVAAMASCSIHPLSKAIAGFSSLHTDTSGSPEVLDFQEIAGRGLSARVDGKQFLLGSSSWMKESGLILEPNAAGRTRVYLAEEQTILGYFEFRNTYREGILDMVRELHGPYKAVILSGDGNYEGKYLRSKLGEDVEMVFDQSPEDKARFVEHLQADGGVMMLGDGINDAKALKASDVGVAVSEDSGNFTPNSDIIMQASEMHKLTDILHFGKDTMTVLRICLVLSLIYNVVGLGFALNGLLTPFIAAILMPLSSISVVIFATGLTTWLAKKRNIV